MIKFFSKHRTAIAFFILFLILCTPIFRVVWKDELISINSLNNNPLTNPLYYNFTTNLPVYFIFLKLATFWGVVENVLYLRYLSIIISLGTALVGYKFVKNNYTKTTAYIFLAIFIFAPIQIYYSQEIRPYILEEFLIISHVFTITKYLETKEKKYMNLTIILTTLLLFTHLLSVIYLASSLLAVFFITLTTKTFKNNLKILLGYTALLIIFTFVTYLVITKNPGFKTSLDQIQEFSPKRNISSPEHIFNTSVQSLNKLKEVLSFYYIYGLYYYRVPIIMQFVFKKIALIILFIGTIKLLLNKGFCKHIPSVYLIFVFYISMFVGSVLELFSLYPFGGRHIMPLVIIYFIILSNGISYLFKGGKVFKATLLTILVLYLGSLYFHTTCSNYIEATNKQVPHVESYSYCIEKLTK